MRLLEVGGFPCAQVQIALVGQVNYHFSLEQNVQAGLAYLLGLDEQVSAEPLEVREPGFSLPFGQTHKMEFHVGPGVVGGPQAPTASLQALPYSMRSLNMPWR